jgi:hypothetical protein
MHQLKCEDDDKQRVVVTAWYCTTQRKREKSCRTSIRTAGSLAEKLTGEPSN